MLGLLGTVTDVGTGRHYHIPEQGRPPARKLELVRMLVIKKLYLRLESDPPG